MVQFHSELSHISSTNCNEDLNEFKRHLSLNHSHHHEEKQLLVTRRLLNKCTGAVFKSHGDFNLQSHRAWRNEAVNEVARGILFMLTVSHKSQPNNYSYRFKTLNKSNRQKRVINCDVSKLCRKYGQVTALYCAFAQYDEKPRFSLQQLWKTQIDRILNLTLGPKVMAWSITS